MPAMIAAAGERASRRFVGFTANIRNPNTRAAYAGAVGLFAARCDERRLSPADLEPVAVSAYVEQLMRTRSAPTVKQHLAAIRMLCDWLVVGQVIPMNPAASVRGLARVVREGKTLVLAAEQARVLLDSIDTSTLIGLRVLAGGGP